jgi:hypothetical protein
MAAHAHMRVYMRHVHGSACVRPSLACMRLSVHVCVYQAPVHGCMRRACARSPVYPSMYASIINGVYTRHVRGSACVRPSLACIRLSVHGTRACIHETRTRSCMVMGSALQPPSLPACLPVYGRPASLPVCPSTAAQPPCLSACLRPPSLPACLPACLSTHGLDPPASQPVCLSTHLIT